MTLLAMAAQCNAFNLFPYYFGDYKIHIRNGFSGNNMLKLQCSSMDDDLGEKSVRNGESFTISFHTSILAITSWECHISRSNVPLGIYHVFGCDYSFLKWCDFRECNWDVREDGIYLQDIPINKYVRWYAYPVSNSIFDKMRVHVINGLTNETLNVHCQSKDDDLGSHDVSVNEEYSWKFKLNFWDTTLFFCNLSWKGGHKSFDAYSSAITDVCEESDCRWRATGDGIYLFIIKHKEYVQDITSFEPPMFGKSNDRGFHCLNILCMLLIKWGLQEHW
ncbi:unnamed protein product [Malus baccata var. baccata]